MDRGDRGVSRWVLYQAELGEERDSRHFPGAPLSTGHQNIIRNVTCWGENVFLGTSIRESAMKMERIILLRDYYMPGTLLNTCRHFLI